MQKILPWKCIAKIFYSNKMYCNLVIIKMHCEWFYYKNAMQEISLKIPLKWFYVQSKVIANYFTITTYGKLFYNKFQWNWFHSKNALQMTFLWKFIEQWFYFKDTLFHYKNALQQILL